MHGFEEKDSLLRRSRTQLDHLVGRHVSHQPVGVGGEDLRLDAGQVVLGKEGDLLEELRTPSVVEVLRGKGLLFGS